MPKLVKIVSNFEKFSSEEVYKLVGSGVNDLYRCQNSELLSNISIVSDSIKTILRELSPVHTAQLLDMVAHSTTESLARFLMTDFGIKTFFNVKGSAIFLNKLLVNRSETNKILDELFESNNIKGKTSKDQETYRRNFRLFIKGIMGSLSVVAGKAAHLKAGKIPHNKLSINTLKYLRMIRDHSNSLPVASEFSNECPITLETITRSSGVMLIAYDKKDRIEHINFSCYSNMGNLNEALRTTGNRCLKTRKECFFVIPLESLTNEQLLTLIDKDGQLKDGALQQYLNPPHDPVALIVFLFERVENIEQLNYFLSNVDLMLEIIPESRGVIFNALERCFSGIIETGEDLKGVLKNFSTEQLAPVMKAMEKYLPRIIKSGKDLKKYIFDPLSTGQRTVVFDAMKKQLPGFIKDAHDLHFILEPLSTEQRTALFNAVEKRLPDIIKNGNGFSFGGVLQHLTIKQRTAAFNAMQKDLPGIIGCSEELKCALKVLSIEQRTILFKEMEERLPDMIENAYDFKCTLKHLSTEQRTVIFNSVEGRLSSLIEEAYDFKRVVQYLSDEQFLLVMKTMEERLPAIITSGYYDLGPVLKPLSTEQRTVILKTMEERLPGIIMGSSDLCSVLKPLSTEQRTVVLKAIEKHLPGIIGSSYVGLTTVLKRLSSTEELMLVMKAIEKHLPGIIKTVGNFSYVLHPLSAEQLPIVVKAVEKHLPHIIKSGVDLKKYVLRALSTEKCTIVLKAMEKCLPEIIKTTDYDLNRLLKVLSAEQITIVVNAMEKRLPDFIDSVYRFGFLFKYLSTDRRTAVLKAMEKRLPGLMNKDDSDFNYALEQLSVEQRAILFNAMEKRQLDSVDSNSESNERIGQGGLSLYSIFKDSITNNEKRFSASLN